MEVFTAAIIVNEPSNNIPYISPRDCNARLTKERNTMTKYYDIGNGHAITVKPAQRGIDDDFIIKLYEDNRFICKEFGNSEYIGVEYGVDL